MSKNTNNADYRRRLFNARKFAEALFNGEVQLYKDVSNGKSVGIYVPKEPMENCELKIENKK